jgi:peptidoglycan/xylan/chitin deacetylase (PgdA/CDA1 family)
MNDAMKTLAMGVMRWSGALALARRATRRSVRILAYHGVDERDEPVLNFDGFQVAPAVFRDQLEIVARRFRVLSLDEILRAWSQGGALPDGATAITFDDGYLNNIEQAAPILQSMSLPATFFVTTGFVDGTHRPWWFDLRRAVERAPSLAWPGERATPTSTPAEKRMAIVAWEARLKSLRHEERATILSSLTSTGRADERTAYPLMTWEDARRLGAQGFAVGPHTVSHPSLGHENEARVVAEVDESVKRIRSEIGAAPLAFSYPYGRPEDITDAVAGAVREAGCLGAVTTTSGLNPAGADPYRLLRINVTGRHTPWALEALLSGVTG